MVEHTLEVVEEPQEPASPIGQTSGPSRGERTAQDIYLCGKCGIIVARDVAPEVLRHSVIRCPNCAALNRMPRGSEGDDVIKGKTANLRTLRT
jgi:DNA-directed RNA polymerase subunit RPC12/RpoP